MPSLNINQNTSHRQAFSAASVTFVSRHWSIPWEMVCGSGRIHSRIRWLHFDALLEDGVPFLDGVPGGFTWYRPGSRILYRAPPLRSLFPARRSEPATNPRHCCIDTSRGASVSSHGSLVRDIAGSGVTLAAPLHRPDARPAPESPDWDRSPGWCGSSFSCTIISLPGDEYCHMSFVGISSFGEKGGLLEVRSSPFSPCPLSNGPG